jgi:hypothetical protein
LYSRIVRVEDNEEPEVSLRGQSTVWIEGGTNEMFDADVSLGNDAIAALTRAKELARIELDAVTVEGGRAAALAVYVCCVDLFELFFLVETGFGVGLKV